MVENAPNFVLYLTQNYNPKQNPHENISFIHFYGVNYASIKGIS